MKILRWLKKSKTIMFNSAMLIALPAFEAVHEFMPELQAYLPESIYKIVGLIVVLANIYLRTKTTKPLSEK